VASSGRRAVHGVIAIGTYGKANATMHVASPDGRCTTSGEPRRPCHWWVEESMTGTYRAEKKLVYEKLAGLIDRVINPVDNVIATGRRYTSSSLL
jgi:hypothetical protein